jgi:uncharacterized membrane protein
MVRFELPQRGMLMITLTLVLLIAAFIVFLVAAFNWFNTPRVNPLALGLALTTLAVLLGRIVT